MYYRHNEENAQRLRKRFAIEETNMFYLRHSFLTDVRENFPYNFDLVFQFITLIFFSVVKLQEQASGYAKELGKHETRLEALKEACKLRPYRPDATLEDRRAGPLMATNKWD